MKLFRKIVDERQELEMMRVERSSFWLIFFGLIAAIFIQLLAMDFRIEHVAGELIVLMAVSIWSLIGYMRCGAWDYFTRPGMKVYVIYSLAAGAASGLLVSLPQYFQSDAPLPECLRLFARLFAITFALTFLLLLLVGTVTKTRQKKLQAEYTDDK